MKTPEKTEDTYYASRYVWNNDRTVVWKEIVRFLKPWLQEDQTILDIGAGYCDFINNVIADEKIALDYSPELTKYAGENIETIISPVTDMSKIAGNTVNVVFASNLFEHLTDVELALTMSEVKRVLKKEGKLILMQPNYRLSYKTYFDDPTHKKVFSDEALRAFLESFGFIVIFKRPRFLPFSLKSRPSVLPLSAWIVRLYLNLPWKPFAGQMLFVGKKKD